MIIILHIYTHVTYMVLCYTRIVLSGCISTTVLPCLRGEMTVIILG